MWFSEPLPQVFRCPVPCRPCPSFPLLTFFPPFHFQVPQDAAQSEGLLESMFPLGGAEPPHQPLDRCVRLLPHVSHTGGFFVAVLQKTHASDTDLKEARKRKLREEYYARVPQGSPAPLLTLFVVAAPALCGASEYVSDGVCPMRCAVGLEVDWR